MAQLSRLAAEQEVTPDVSGAQVRDVKGACSFKVAVPVVPASRVAEVEAQHADATVRQLVGTVAADVDRSAEPGRPLRGGLEGCVPGVLDAEPDGAAELVAAGMLLGVREHEVLVWHDDVDLIAVAGRKRSAV